MSNKSNNSNSYSGITINNNNNRGLEIERNEVRQIVRSSFGSAVKQKGSDKWDRKRILSPSEFS